MQHIKEGLKNFRHHHFRQFLAALTIGFSMLILAIAFAFYQGSQNKLQEISQNFDLQIYFKTETPLKEIQRIKMEIENQFNVQNIQYISSKQALENLEKTFPNQIEFYQTYSLTNPLPQLLKIRTSNLNEQQTIFENLQNSKDSELILEKQIQNSTNQIRNNFFNFQRTTKQILIWTLLTFTIVLSLIMFNIIHLSLMERHKEIKIKQLIGAHFDFIRKPFMVESCLLAFFSFIIGAILIVTADIFVPVNLMSYLNINYWLIQIFLCTGISLITSFMIVEYHLKKQTFVHE